MPSGSNRGLPIVFLKKNSLFGKLAHFKRPNGAFSPIANRAQMPMNNGNVTRAAIGVAQGTFDASFNANESLAVLCILRGVSGASGAGAGGGRQKRKGPRRLTGGRERGAEV